MVLPMSCPLDYDPSSADDVQETNIWPPAELYRVTWLSEHWDAYNNFFMKQFHKFTAFFKPIVNSPLPVLPILAHF